MQIWGPTLFNSLRPRVIRFGLLLRLLKQLGSQELLATRPIEEKPMTDKTMPKGSFPAMNPVHYRAVMGLRRVARRRPTPSIFSCVWPIVGRLKRRSSCFCGVGVLGAIGLTTRFRRLSL